MPTEYILSIFIILDLAPCWAIMVPSPLPAFLVLMDIKACILTFFLQIVSISNKRIELQISHEMKQIPLKPYNSSVSKYIHTCLFIFFSLFLDIGAGTNEVSVLQRLFLKSFFCMTCQQKEVQYTRRKEVVALFDNVTRPESQQG